MCGIAGFWEYGVDSVKASGIVANMAGKLRHRGPNSSGSWVDNGDGIYMGHRRLAVLDVSDAGDQPMVSSCGRWVIAFNGEIYNHVDIRQKLEKTGKAPTWRGHSDTETLLEAFAVWDVETVLKLAVGMFAIALWDRSQRSLVLARDRIGEKPMYYGWQDDVFLFGSELKALRAHPGFRDEVESAAVGLLLDHNYIPAPFSIYKGVYKLPAASWLTISYADFAKRKTPSSEKYWSFNETVIAGLSTPFLGSESEAADELENLLRQAIQGQMLSDVPIGAFLSGGIDSSTIVALMQSLSPVPINTFSIGMPEDKLDETQYAKAVSKYLGTNHISHIIKPEEALSIIPRLSEIWDEPFADSSQIPTWLVCELAKKYVTVSLSGDGGDENFLGYNRYRNCRLLWKYRGMSRFPFELCAAIYNRLNLPGASRLSAARMRATKSLLKAQTLEEMIDIYTSPYRGESIPLLKVPENIKTLQKANWDYPKSLVDPALVAAWRDATSYLPEDIFQKVDRASMNVSLETRAPFLDHRIVEFAWRLPVNYKLKERTTKHVLRQVLYRHLPPAMFDRPKQGFSIPVARWLRKELREWAESLLDKNNLISSGLNADVIHNYWTKHLQGEDYSERLWGILMLQNFMKGGNND